MEPDRLQRRGPTIGKIAPREFAQARAGKVDRKLGATQNHLGQFVELVGLLVPNERSCRKVASHAERGRAREHERRKYESRSLQSHSARRNRGKRRPILIRTR